MSQKPPSQGVSKPPVLRPHEGSGISIGGISMLRVNLPQAAATLKSPLGSGKKNRGVVLLNRRSTKPPGKSYQNPF